jgi:hypothetical protein
MRDKMSKQYRRELGNWTGSTALWILMLATAGCSRDSKYLAEAGTRSDAVGANADSNADASIAGLDGMPTAGAGGSGGILGGTGGSGGGTVSAQDTGVGGFLHIHGVYTDSSRFGEFVDGIS